LTITDLIQSLSLLLVAGALIASIRQTRAIAHQARQATKALQDATLQSFVRNQNGSREAFFLDHPELLAWHLSTRGYPATDAAENLRRLYVLNKFDIHEYNYLAHSEGQFRDDICSGWKNVMLVDFNQVPEFREMWPAAKRFLAPSFVKFVEKHCGMVPDKGESGLQPPDTHTYYRQQPQRPGETPDQKPEGH
jgi:hypothetical protein